MTHPTDPVAAMREACVKHVADAIAACYRRAWTSPDEMRGATGALKRLAVSMANLPLPAAPAPTRPRVSTAGSGQEARLVVTPAAPSRPADDGAHEGGLMARVENHLRGQVGLPPAPIATPADDAVARARERWERASRRYFDARLALAAAYDLASLNVAEVGERAAAREAKDAYTALLAAERAERDAKGGERG